MKNILKIILFFTILGILSGCGTKTNDTATEKSEEETSETQTNNEKGIKGEIVKLGTSVLGKDLVEFIEPYFEEESGYDLEIQVFEDFVMPNTATVEGSIDVNVYQYESFLDQYNVDSETNLKSYAKTFGLIEGIYSSKVTGFYDLKEGSKVGVIGSPSNKAVALRMLQDEGLIKLDPNVAMPNVVDIVENPLNLEIIEMNDGRSLAMAIDDFDIIQTSGINMEMSGYDPTDALAFASDEIHDELAYCIVVNENNTNAEWLAALEKALNSEIMSKYIEENYKGSYFLLEDTLN